ncbi:hypothetical protein THSYN_23455 [Candidatus Thiodictyon syntrophicum]|uniref:Uncharacterized protein n=1 Tax=Candidatus Thiodictyon syntrophicum TaxID=1166950 RepID=A0A2K8UET3_9GAMM|nr:hypothetical protein THSYN_23455 [Candidatus Thiodictyon syntrophicum]
MLAAEAIQHELSLAVFGLVQAPLTASASVSVFSQWPLLFASSQEFSVQFPASWLLFASVHNGFK